MVAVLGVNALRVLLISLPWYAIFDGIFFVLFLLLRTPFFDTDIYLIILNPDGCP